MTDDGHVLEAETYVGGHVEALESGLSNYSIVKQMVIIIVHIFLNILITLSTFSVNFVFFIRDLAFLLTSIKFQNAYLYNYFYFLLFFLRKLPFVHGQI